MIWKAGRKDDARNRPQQESTHSEPAVTDSESSVTVSPSRARLNATIERWAYGTGTVTGAARALLADVVNAVKNSTRAFSEAHRKAYSQKHAVRRKL